MLGGIFPTWKYFQMMLFGSFYSLFWVNFIMIFAEKAKK